MDYVTEILAHFIVCAQKRSFWIIFSVSNLKSAKTLFLEQTASS